MFKSKHGPFWKVGHYQRSNAWSRVAHRGFYSCLRPHPITTRVSIDDLELLAWYPQLDKKAEKAIHRRFVGLVGEWYGEDNIAEVLSAAAELAGGINLAGSCNRAEALATRRRL